MASRVALRRVLPRAARRGAAPFAPLQARAYWGLDKAEAEKNASKENPIFGSYRDDEAKKPKSAEDPEPNFWDSAASRAPRQYDSIGLLIQDNKFDDGHLFGDAALDEESHIEPDGSVLTSGAYDSRRQKRGLRQRDIDYGDLKPDVTIDENCLRGGSLLLRKKDFESTGNFVDVHAPAEVDAGPVSEAEAERFQREALAQAREDAKAAATFRNKKIYRCESPYEVLFQYKAHSSTYTDSNLANCIFHIATIYARRRYPLPDVHDPRTQKMCDDMVSRVDSLSAKHLANVAWSVARMDNIESARPLLLAVAQVSIREISKFNSEKLANLLWAFGAAGIDARDLFAAAVPAALRQLGRFTPQELSIVVWAYATMGYQAPNLFEGVADQTVLQLSKFTHYDLSTTLWAFAKAGATKRPSGHRFFDVVSQDLSQSKIRGWKTSSMSMAVWAYAEADFHAPQIFAYVADAAPERIPGFRGQEFADTVWAFAKAGVHSQHLFDTMVLYAPQKIKLFSPTDLANCMWGFAKAKIKAPEFHKLVVKHATKEATRFLPYDLETMSWALSTMGKKSQGLYNAIGEEATFRVVSLSPKNMATIAWAFANADVRAPAMFAAFAGEARLKVEDFDEEQLANLLWAFSKNGGHGAAQDLFELAAPHVVERLDKFKPHALASVVYAYSRAGAAQTTQRALFSAVASHVPDIVRDFDATELSIMAWAFATAKVESPEMYAAIALQAEKTIREFDSHELANIAWAFSTAKITAPRLFEVVADQAAKKLKHFEAAELANLARAYSQADLYLAHKDVFAAIGAEAMAKMAAFSPRDLVNVTRAFADCGTFPADLVAAIAQEAQEKIWIFDTGDLNDLEQAFRDCAVDVPTLFEAAAIVKDARALSDKVRDEEKRVKQALREATETAKQLARADLAAEVATNTDEDDEVDEDDGPKGLIGKDTDGINYRDYSSDYTSREELNRGHAWEHDAGERRH
ncbi:hypothetical protein M885DRAFT_526904 [Pelagophyceae sp. CCMP2097]|nr:hypothetical protein M885DRAFT_526904 [Pelagophyceae sp. CCMP2097]